LAEKRVSVVLTQPYLDAMDRLIRDGVYISRAEVVKDALRRLFRHYGIRIYEAQDEKDCPRSPTA
jgi:Arc/MetJ-type ribon-helix-helix transcriptional regulator